MLFGSALLCLELLTFVKPVRTDSCRVLETLLALEGDDSGGEATCKKHAEGQVPLTSITKGGERDGQRNHFLYQPNRLPKRSYVSSTARTQPFTSSTFGDHVVIVDGMAPCRRSGPNGQGRCFVTAEKWDIFCMLPPNELVPGLRW